MFKMKKLFLLFTVVSICLLSIFGLTHITKSENTSNDADQAEEEFLDISKDNVEEESEEEFLEEKVEYDNFSELIIETYVDTSIDVSTFDAFISAVASSSTYGTINITAGFTATSDIYVYGTRRINMNGCTINMQNYSIYCCDNTTFVEGKIIGTKNATYDFNEGIIHLNYAANTLNLLSMFVDAKGTAAAVYCRRGSTTYNDPNHEGIFISNSTIQNTGAGPAVYAGAYQIYKVRINESTISVSSNTKYGVTNATLGRTKTRHPYAVFSTYANIIIESNSRVMNLSNNVYGRALESYYENVNIDSSSSIEGALVPGQGTINIDGSVASIDDCKFNNVYSTDKKNIVNINITGHLSSFKTTNGIYYNINVSGKGNFTFDYWGNFNYEEVVPSSCFNFTISGDAVANFPQLPRNSKTPCQIKILGGTINGNIQIPENGTLVMDAGRINGGIYSVNSNVTINNGTIECCKSYNDIFYNHCIRMCGIGSCIIKDGEFIDTYGNQVIYSTARTSLNIQGGTFRSTSSKYNHNLITVTDSATCTISNGTFINNRYGHAAVAVKGTSTLDISNGNFQGTGKAIAIESATSVNITGGNFTSNYGIWIRNDSTTSPITISNINMNTGWDGIRTYNDWIGGSIPASKNLTINVDNATIYSPTRSITGDSSSNSIFNITNSSIQHIYNRSDMKYYIGMNTTIQTAESCSSNGINITLDNCDVDSIIPYSTSPQNIPHQNKVSLKNRVILNKLYYCDISLLADTDLGMTDSKVYLYGTNTMNPQGYIFNGLTSNFEIQSEGSLTISGSGTIKSKSGDGGAFINYGTFTINSPNITVSNYDSVSGGNAIENNGALSIYSGNITSVGGNSLDNNNGIASIFGGTFNGTISLFNDVTLYLSGTPTISENIYLNSTTAKLYGRNEASTASYTGSMIGVMCNLTCFTSKQTAVYDGTIAYFNCVNPGFSFVANGSNLDIDLNAATITKSSGINKTYNGSASNINVTPSHTLVVSYTYQWYNSNGTAITGATTNTLSRTNVADSGTYYCIVTAKQNSFSKSTNSGNIVVTINKADITGIEFSGSTITYDKDTHSLKITGTLPEKVSVSYTLNGTAFSGVSNAGSYNVKAVFTNNNSNYNDLAPMSATLTIQPKDVTVEFKDYENLVYNKNEQEITVNLKGVIDGDNCTIKTMTGNKGKNAGDYTCEVTEISNSNYALSGKTSQAWSIAKYQVEKPVEDTTVYTYTGEEQTYQVATSEFYTVTNQTQKEAGNYTVTIKLNDTDNYEWKDKTIEKLEYSFRIQQKAVNIIWSENTFTYNGEEQDKSGIIAYYLTLPSSTKNYLTVRCNSASFKLAATYTFSVELDDTKNYTVANSSDSHNYTIDKASITLQAEDKSSAYGASLEALTYKVVSGTNYNAEITPVLTTTATATSNVDTYPITITAKNDNYDITLTNGTYIITSKAIEVSIDDQIAGYTGEEPVVDQTAYTTEETGDLGIVISKEAGVVVGDYKLTATSTNTNYDITFVYTNGDHSIYTIEKETLKVTTENYSGTYDKESHSGSVLVADVDSSVYTIYYSTDGQLTEENYSTASTTNPSFTNAGKTTVYFYIVAHDYKNRGGSFTVEITKKEVTVTFSGYEGLVYDSTEKTITATLVGVIDGDTCTITGITGNKNTNAESYTCEVTEISNSNYALSGTTTQGYTIEKAKITFTAENKSSVYKEELQELTFSLVSGINYNNEITPVVTTTATTTSNVGTYPITITASNDNYDITLNNGTYTIEKAKITFTAEDKTSTYGAFLEALTYTVSGTNYDGITPVVTTTATTTSNVGTYPITITASNDNYDITLNDGTYSITKATVSGIAFTDKEVDYNGEIQTIEITGELPEEISVEYHYNSEVFSGKKDAGSYLVEASFIVGDNYNEIAPMTATLLIQPKAIEVSILDQSSSYTGEEPEIDQTQYTTEETGDLGIVITKEAGVVVGEYKLTATSSNTNYDITFVYTNGDHSIYTIENKAIKVATENYSGTYDKESHSGAVNVADLESSEYTIYYSTTEELTEANYSTASTTNPSFTDAGTTTVYYYIVAHDYKNCGGSFTVEIKKKEVTVTFSGYEGLVYDSTEKTIEATLDGVIEGDNCTITGITGNKNTNAGSYTCEVTEISNPNYTLSGTTTQEYTIEKAEITFTAEDKSSVYKEELQELTYSLVSGTNYNNEITPVVTTTATTTSNVGDYPITITATNDNYDITLNDGTYTITSKAIEVSVLDKSSMYTGEEPEIDQTQYTTEETGDLEIVITKESGVNVGEYKLTATSSNTNYTITFVYTNETYSVYTITKAVYHDITCEEITVEYEEGLTLKNVSLKPGFNFKNPETVLVVDTIKKYEAMYNEDPQNYEDYELKIQVRVIYKKVDPEILTIPEATELIYGETLESSILSHGLANVEGNFSWSDPTQDAETGNLEYEVTFIPTDTKRYNTITFKVSVRVKKAIPKIITLPEATDILVGQNLDKSILTAGLANVDGKFSWVNSDTIPGIGENSYEVVFTPKDTANYEEVVFEVPMKTEKLSTSEDGSIEVNKDNYEELKEIVDNYNGLTEEEKNKLDTDVKEEIQRLDQALKNYKKQNELPKILIESIGIPCILALVVGMVIHIRRKKKGITNPDDNDEDEDD